MTPPLPIPSHTTPVAAVPSPPPPHGAAPLWPARRGVANIATPSMRPAGPVSVLAGNGGDARRSAACTTETVAAISDGTRAAQVVFLRDGAVDTVDTDDLAVIRQFRAAQALRADWARRARQAIENQGAVNPRLDRAWRERGAEDPDQDPLDAA